MALRIATRDNNKVILTVELSDRVHPWPLGQYLINIYELYSCHLWLSKVEREGHAPDPYSPTDDEDMFVERLEVGTPNLVELLGQLEHLGPVYVCLVTFLTTTLGAATVAAKLVEVKQKLLELGIKEAELELTKLDLRERAKVAYENGTITKEQYEHKCVVAESSRSLFAQIHETVRTPRLRKK